MERLQRLAPRIHVVRQTAQPAIRVRVPRTKMRGRVTFKAVPSLAAGADSAGEPHSLRSRGLTFELSRARQRGVLDSKRKMGRRPSACWPARRAVGARLERRVRPRASNRRALPCDGRDGATGRTGAAMAKRTATVLPAAEMLAAERTLPAVGQPINWTSTARVGERMRKGAHLTNWNNSGQAKSHEFARRCERARLRRWCRGGRTNKLNSTLREDGTAVTTCRL